MDTVLHDLLDIHVLGEWKNTHSTIPSHINVASRKEKIFPNVSRYSVGMVLLELGKIEAFINEKSYERLKRSRKDSLDVAFNEFAPSGNENSVLLQLLIAPINFNLDMLNPDDLGVSFHFIFVSKNSTIMFKVVLLTSLNFCIFCNF